MSAWRNAVDFHTPELAAAQFAVLSAIAGHANDDGIAFPSMRTIAVRAHCTDRNASRTIKQLEEAGYLKRVRQVRANGSSSSNLYQISQVLLDCVDECRCPIAVRARKDSTPEAPPKKTRTPIPADAPADTLGPPNCAERAEAPEYEAVTAIVYGQPAAERYAAPDPIVQAEQIWKDAYFGDSPAGLLRKKLSPLFAKHDTGKVMAAWENYCNNVGAAYINIDKFVATWGSWENGPPAKGGADPLAAHREVFGGSK